MAGTRRQFTAEFKAKVVLQVISGEKTASELCRAYKLNPTMLNRWRTEFIEQASSVFEQGGTSQGNQQQIAELECLVGPLTMQLEIAKKASNYLNLGRNGRS
jgi:transposase